MKQHLAQFRKAYAALSVVLLGAVAAGLITGSTAVWVSLLVTAGASWLGVAVTPPNAAKKNAAKG